MNTQYRTAKEVMTLLLAGKKVRKQDWVNNVYCHLFDGRLVDQDGDSTVITLTDLDDYDYWEEYKKQLNFCDFVVGKRYRTNMSQYTGIVVRTLTSEYVFEVIYKNKYHVVGIIDKEVPFYFNVNYFNWTKEYYPQSFLMEEVL